MKAYLLIDVNIVESKSSGAIFGRTKGVGFARYLG